MIDVDVWACCVTVLLASPAQFKLHSTTYTSEDDSTIHPIEHVSNMKAGTGHPNQKPCRVHTRSGLKALRKDPSLTYGHAPNTAHIHTPRVICGTIPPASARVSQSETASLFRLPRCMLQIADQQHEACSLSGGSVSTRLCIMGRPRHTCPTPAPSNTHAND